MATYEKTSILDAEISAFDENALLSMVPDSSAVFPDSSIRKYRAAYYGVRSSEKINLLQQELISDFNFCYNKLSTTHENIKYLLYIVNNFKVPR